MSNAQNPFRHHHDHDHGHGHDHNHEHEHDHDHDHGPEHEIDPAQQSLADALRFSFGVLKWVLVVLLVFYCFSGIFNVPADKAGLRLTFGRVQGVGEDRVLKSGKVHLSLPYPVNEVVLVPSVTSVNSIDLNKEFWYVNYNAAAKDDEIAPPAGSLDPQTVGSLLTGDRNIIHARFRLQWVISDPIKYIENVDDMGLAEQLVRAAAEEGVIHAAATAEADAVLKGQFARGRAVAEAQRILDAQQTGLSLLGDFFLVDKTSMPGSVEKVYKEVGIAESEKAQEIEKARQEYTKVMVETAGEAHQPLWSLIKEYQTASAAGDAKALAAMDAKLDEVFKSLAIGGEHGPITLTGKVAELINDANNYRSAIVAQVQGEANAFEALYEKYKAEPSLRRILKDRLWQDAREEIMTGDVETFYLTQGQTYLDLNRDPKVTKARNEKLLKEQAGIK